MDVELLVDVTIVARLMLSLGSVSLRLPSWFAMAAGVGMVLAVMRLVHNPVALLLFRSSPEWRCAEVADTRRLIREDYAYQNDIS